MKLKHIATIILAFAFLFTCGCGRTKETEAVYISPDFAFSDDMAVYMTSYMKLMLKDEMKAGGADLSVPLSEQEKSEDETWEDFLYSKVEESIKNILLYCEAAYLDKYTISEGMIYKANEIVTYLSDTAEEAGMTAEEYIRETYGEDVTLDGLKTCTEMMALCEGYELDLTERFDVTEDEIISYADENPNKFLKFDALRYTTKDKDIADRLSSSNDRDGFLKVMSSVSGVNLTDSDKNGIADSLEVSGAIVSEDIAGEFAMEDDRTVGDTTVTEKDGKYTVTMLLSLPARDFSLIWDFRMIYISPESSEDPILDANSLLEQWKEKNGGEEGFSNLAARYSDDPSAYYGGLFSGTSLADMPTDSIAKWVCDNARSEGDATAIEHGDDGAFMLYYIEGNIPRWTYEAKNAIRSDKVKEKMDSVEEELKSDFVLNEKLLHSIVKKACEIEE